MQAEKAQIVATQPLQRIATLESKHEKLRASLAEAQTAPLDLLEQQEKRTAKSNKRKKHKRKKQ